MAKKKKVEEAVEETVQVKETVQETVIEENPKVQYDGITDRAYSSLKYNK